MKKVIHYLFLIGLWLFKIWFKGILMYSLFYSCKILQEIWELHNSLKVHKTEFRQKRPEGKLPVSKTSSKVSLNISLDPSSLRYLSWANTIIYSFVEGVPGTQETVSQAGLRSAPASTFLMLLIAPWSASGHPPAFTSSMRLIRPNMSGFCPSLSLLSFM